MARGIFSNDKEFKRFTQQLRDLFDLTTAVGGGEGPLYGATDCETNELLDAKAIMLEHARQIYADISGLSLALRFPCSFCQFESRRWTRRTRCRKCLSY